MALTVITTKPFAGYADFDACVAANQDKDDPEAYCGRIQADAEKARIYVKDPSRAPKGVQLTKGPRGGLYFDSSQMPKRTPYKPLKLPKKPAGKKGPKAKEPKPEKREIGAPLRGPEDLPASVQREAPEVQAAYTKIFNDTLAAGGSEADALAAAKQALPKRGAKPKEPKPEKRQVGQPFNSFDDPSIPLKVRQESEQVKRDWVLTFNVELKKGGSEADAIQAANEKLPDRKKPKPVKPPTTSLPKTEESKMSFTTQKDILTRAMICLFVPQGIAEMIALPEQDALSGVLREPADDLHITLAYFPHVDPEDRDDLLAAAARCAYFYSPCEAEIEGAAQFFSDDDLIPHVLLVNPDRIAGIRSEVLMNASHLNPARNHGFIPHITLAYAPDGVEVNLPDIPDVPLLFDHISVRFGDGEQHDFRMGMLAEPLTAYRALDLSEKVDTPNSVSETPSDPSVPTTDQGKMEDAAINTLETDKAGRRLSGRWREVLASAVDPLKKLLAFADYDDDEDEEKDMQVRSLNDEDRFLIFKDRNGVDRWLSYSSNGFKDREGEIVSTKMLEDAAEYASKTGNYGPLRLFHIPGADIGDCDFSGVQGRFLIESGTFRDDALGQAGKAYLENCSEEIGVSIGFTHPVDALKDGVYHEGIITERSVCPLTMAANPFTSFISYKEAGAMDAIRTSWLTKVLGEDLATEVISKADAASKALEGQVAFKDNSAVLAAIDTLKGVTTTDEQKAAIDTLVLSFAAKADEKKAEDDAVDDEDEKAKATLDSIVSQVSGLLAPIGESIKQVSDSVAGLTAQVDQMKEGQKAIAERVDNVENVQKSTPAGASAYRASAAPDNVVDAAEAKKANPEGHQETEKSPVAAFVAQITKTIN